MGRPHAYEFPLRPDFTAQLVLPLDLTEAEAMRLCAMIRTLPPPTPTPEPRRG